MKSIAACRNVGQASARLQPAAGFSLSVRIFVEISVGQTKERRAEAACTSREQKKSVPQAGETACPTYLD